MRASAVAPRWMFTILLLLSVTASAAPAQRATQLALDGRRLPLQTDSFAIYIIQGRDTVRTGSLIDVLRADGPRVTRIYSQTDRVLGPQLDTIVATLPDLRPTSVRSASAQGLRRLVYSSDLVAGWTRLPNGDSVSVRVRLPAVVYDGASYDLVVRSSALAAGFTLTVPAFIVGPNTVIPIVGRVTASAVVDGHQCWVFEANFAGMPVTFWIDKTTRALRRQLMQPRVDLAILCAHTAAH
jgi:hypothetical protein